MVDDLHIINCGRYYTVVNKSHYAKYKHHTHFNHIKGAKILKKLVEREIVPYSPYLAESALRVSINEDYKNKILEEWDR